MVFRSKLKFFYGNSTNTIIVGVSHAPPNSKINVIKMNDVYEGWVNKCCDTVIQV